MIVDFHAEVTSEKVAMGWHLDGRVAAVLGTHTHVPTADGRVLPGGTAFISDVGMTGARTSVLGVKPEQALASLITQMPTRFETADEDVWVMGAWSTSTSGTGGLDRAGDGSGSVGASAAQPRLSRPPGPPGTAGRTRRCRGRTSVQR